MKKNEFPFTKSTIDSLAPPEKGKRSMYYDSKVPHLAIRVSNTGHKSFLVYRGLNGRVLKRTLGAYPAMTIEQARFLAAEINSAPNKGVDPLDEKRALRAEATLGEVFEQYLTCYAKEHCKTWKGMEYSFNLYLKDFRHRRVNSINKQEVQKLHSEIGKKSGHTTANRAIELLKAIINKGITWGLADCKNPCIGITKFKLKDRKRFVKEHEIPRLVVAIAAEPNRDIRDFVTLALSTGARRSNILQMRWRNVDLDGGVWIIPETKNGEPQTILLTPEELTLLKERFDHRRSFEWVFPGTGKRGHLDDPKKGWHRILAAAGIEDLRLHDLRRTLGSWMAMTGASLSVIGDALNHKDVTTTRKVYAQTANEAELAARKVAHKAMFQTSAGVGVGREPSTKRRHGQKG